MWYFSGHTGSYNGKIKNLKIKAKENVQVVGLKEKINRTLPFFH